MVNVSAMIVLGSAGAVLADTRKEKGDSGGMPMADQREAGRMEAAWAAGGLAVAAAASLERQPGDEFRPGPASAYEWTVGTLKKEF